LACAIRPYGRKRDLLCVILKPIIRWRSYRPPGIGEAIRKFEESSADQKASPVSLIQFAEIKGLAREVGAQLDELLEHENVLVPSRIGLDIQTDDGGRVTFVPKVEGLPPSSFEDAFLALDDVDNVYSCEVGGKKVRVVLDDTQREVLRRMQRIRHVGGADRSAVLRDPTSLFDGVSGAVEIDMKEFGPIAGGQTTMQRTWNIKPVDGEAFL
jgi:hypothetical protein